MDIASKEPISGLTHARYVTLFLAALLTGRTVKSMERKIQRGVWLEGYEYYKDPDGSIIIDMEGIATWVRGERVLESNPSKKPSESPSSGRTNAAVKRLRSDQHPPT